MIKCIGCYELLREELKLSEGRTRVIYNCPRYFPYAPVVSGLVHPGKGIVEAVKDCPEGIGEHCILCSQPAVRNYGEPPFAFACKQHDQAWGEWLKAHPERRAHVAPRQRVVRANWIEVFREFIEDMRLQGEGIP